MGNGKVPMSSITFSGDTSVLVMIVPDGTEVAMFYPLNTMDPRRSFVLEKEGYSIGNLLVKGDFQYIANESLFESDCEGLKKLLKGTDKGKVSGPKSAIIFLEEDDVETLQSIQSICEESWIEWMSLVFPEENSL